MSTHSKLFLIGLSVLEISIIAAFIVLGLASQDPQLLSRGGALVAACAAGAILVQILLEIEIEGERARSRSTTNETNTIYSRSRVRFMERIKAARRTQKDSRLKTERLKIAAIVVVWAVIGEFLNGFGDLLLQSAFR